jgi:hypothetical protein
MFKSFMGSHGQTNVCDEQLAHKFKSIENKKESHSAIDNMDDWKKKREYCLDHSK